jgi:putative transposase
MENTEFTEEQIAFVLRQAQTGTRVEEVCRKFGVSQAAFYNWRKNYGGLGASELRRLKQLEADNSRLKGLVADLSLDKEMLQDVIQEKL